MLLIIRDLFFVTLEGIIFLLLFVFLNALNGFVLNNKVKSFIFIFLYAILSFWTSSFIPDVMNSISHLIFTTLILSSLTRTNLMGSFISIALCAVFIFFVETVTIIIPIIFLKLSIEEIVNSGTITTVFGTSVKIIELTISIFLIRSKIKIKWLSNFKKPNLMY